MKKQVLKLTESDLHNIIKESVKNILKEVYLEPSKDEYNDGYTYTGTIGGEDADWYGDGSDLKQAWLIFWRNLKASSKSPQTINWGVYEKYKNDPMAIADCFERYGIEYRDLLDDAGKNLDYKYWGKGVPKA